MASKERELLKELSTKDMVSYYYPELINRIKELLSQPEREPLSGSEISRGFRADGDVTNAESYWAGVAYAEEQHGIRGVDDE